MRHRVSIKKVSRFADGMCAGRAKEVLEAHIDGCAVCQENLSIIKNYKLLLGRLDTIRESEGFDFEFRRKLDEVIARSRLKRTSAGDIIPRMLETLGRIALPRTPVLIRATLSLFFVIAAGVLTFCCTSVELPAVVSATGSAKIYSARYASQRDMSAGVAMKVEKGDVITTGPGSTVDIEVPSRFALRVKEKTTLKVARLGHRFWGDGCAFDLANGRTLVRIDKRRDGSEVIIRTPALEASALGTKFLVEASQRDKGRTKVGVLDGSVAVRKSAGRPAGSPGEAEVVLSAGQKIEGIMGGPLGQPGRLVEAEWEELEELYQIGKKPLVVLLVRNTPMRVRELLRPCPIYFYDEKPRELPELFGKALRSINEAIKTGDKKAHLDSIRILEELVSARPNPKYEPQLQLFIGAYYEYIGLHKEAIQSFQKVIDKYPQATYASMAKCAIALIYEEKLNDRQRAEKEFQEIIKTYPYSLEARFVEDKLENKKVN